MNRMPTAPKPIQTFAELLAPETEANFFGSIYGKRWALLKGDAAKAAAVFDWDGLNDVLAMDVWNAGTITMMLDGKRVPPNAYCQQGVNRAKVNGIYPVRERVLKLLRDGASLVLNDMASLAAPVQAVQEILNASLNGRGAANLYYSQQKRRAFHSHFDRHEVLALQIQGTKAWRIYRGRAEAPIEHPQFLNMPQAEYDRMKGPLDQEVTTEPGDILYLPRGQFHDALATDGDSMHITFSTVVPMGLHLVYDMANRLVGDPAFRHDLPRLDGPDGEAALAKHIEALLDRLKEHYSGRQGLDIAKAIVEDFGQKPIQRFDIPNHREG